MRRLAEAAGSDRRIMDLFIFADRFWGGGVDFVHLIARRTAQRPAKTVTQRPFPK
jgi:hypothetical protein